MTAGDLLDLPALEARLEELYRLPFGWNSHDARPPDRSTRDAVLWVALVLSPGRGHPEVLPLVNGGIQLEWAPLEVDIHPDGRICAWAEGMVYEFTLGGGR